jgi:hypothetical protein
MKGTEQHYTAEQIGELLGGVSKRTVQRLMRPGKLWPVVKLSRKVVLVPASVVNHFLADRTWNPKEIAPAA